MESDTTSVTADSSEMTDLSRHPIEVSHRLRLLWIGAQEPSWIGLALRLDADGCLEPRFRWASTPSEALTVLRDENFDCVLISDSTTTHSPAPAQLPLHPSNSEPRAGSAVRRTRVPDGSSKEQSRSQSIRLPSTTPDPLPLRWILRLTTQAPSRHTPPRQGRPLGSCQARLLCEGSQTRQGFSLAVLSRTWHCSSIRQ